MEFKQNGMLWCVRLTHAEVERIGAVGDVLAQLPEPIISKSITVAVTYVKIVDWIGGSNGVEIIGVLGYMGISVTPLNWSAFQFLAKFPSLITESAEQLGDIIFKTITYWKDKIDIPLPFVIAFPFIFGPIVLADKLLGKIFRRKHGGMRADKREAGSQEKFFLVDLPEENKVALLSWRGYVRAKDGGGNEVWADKPWIRSHEKWELERNDDGTVSFRSWNGHYFIAKGGGGKECDADSREKGSWERFFMEFHEDGVFSLRTLEKGLYVHVKD
jgi:hypothetical protein